MRELHLFAGIGGGILGGLLLGHTPVCAVEIDPYCRKVLRARQADGLLPDFPIFDDIRQFDAREWRGRVDVVCGGFPCQPWSTAGKRLGTADPRHLWPEMARVVAECRPAYVFAENVALAAFQEPYGDLVAMGYRVPPALCLAAEDVGAPHRRKRWWMLAADADGDQLREQQGRLQPGRAGAAESVDDGAVGQMADPSSIGWGARRPEPAREQGRSGAAGGGGAVGYADSVRELQPQGRELQERGRVGYAGWWTTEPDVGRVANGVTYWSHGAIEGDEEKHDQASISEGASSNRRCEVPSVRRSRAAREASPGLQRAVASRVAVPAMPCEGGSSGRDEEEKAAARLRSVQTLLHAAPQHESDVLSEVLLLARCEERGEAVAGAFSPAGMRLLRQRLREASVAGEDVREVLRQQARLVASQRVGRLRALGNAQVPLQAATAFRQLMERFL